MSGLKNNKRGRPKRNNITALQQHQLNEATTEADTAFRNLDIQQPLTIVKRATNEEEDASTSQSTTLETLAGVQVARLPKVQYEKREQQDPEEDEDYIAEQNYQQEHLLSLHHQSQPNHPNLPYKRPENHYIHYIEPSDVELYDSVEYDMDEQDKEWLQLYNAERRKESPGEISPYLFECIMDKLEKEWFHLVSNFFFFYLSK